jgi:hypothetical protein
MSSPYINADTTTWGIGTDEIVGEMNKTTGIMDTILVTPLIMIFLLTYSRIRIRY